MKKLNLIIVLLVIIISNTLGQQPISFNEKTIQYRIGNSDYESNSISIKEVEDAVSVQEYVLEAKKNPGMKVFVGESDTTIYSKYGINYSTSIKKSWIMFNGKEEIVGYELVKKDTIWSPIVILTILFCWYLMLGIAKGSGIKNPNIIIIESAIIGLLFVLLFEDQGANIFWVGGIYLLTTIIGYIIGYMIGKNTSAEVEEDEHKMMEAF